MPDITTLPVAPLESVATWVESLGQAADELPLVCQELAAAQALRWPPPLCLLGPASPAQRQELARPPPRSQRVAAARLKDCRVVGRGLLVDAAGRLLVSPQIHGFAGAANPQYEDLLWTWLELDEPRPDGAVARRDLAALVPRPLPGAYVLLAQPGHRVFGHWLLEVMPRLAMARHLGLGQLPLLLPHPLPAFAAACLELLEIDRGQLVLYDQHREAPAPETLYIVPSLSYGTHFAPLGREVFDAIAAAADPNPRGASRRLFLSRAGLGSDMRHVNRAELWPLLARLGFEEIRPETLPLARQIALVRAASHVVAEDGSAAHLMAYAPAGLRALVLAAGTRRLHLHAALAQLRRHRIGFLIGEPQPSRTTSHVDFRVEPALLEQALALLLPVT